MRKLDEMQIALMKNQFKLMYADIGFTESLEVLNEILQTATILTEVLINEKRREREEGMDAP